MINEETLKSELTVFVYSIINKTREYNSKSFFSRKFEKLYIDLDSIFRPVGYSYPDGDEEFEYENIYYKIGETILESEAYQRVYALIKENFSEKFESENNLFKSDIDKLRLLLSTYMHLLVRNTLHFDYKYNFIIDKVGYKKSSEEYSRVFEEALKQFESLTSEQILEGISLFHTKMIEKFTDVLISDLYDKPTIFYYKLFLNGIELEQDEYKILDNVTLRKIRYKDEFNSDKRPYKKFRSFNSNYPTCIIEFPSYSSSIYDNDNYKKVVLDSLKLFTYNSFKIIYEFEYPESIKKQFCSENNFHTENFKRKYSFVPLMIPTKPKLFSEENATKLGKIINLIDNLYKDKNSEVNFVKVSLNFFLEALSKSWPSAIITYSVLSLESLYNTSDRDVGKNLRDKCSLLLSIIREINLKEYDRFSKKLTSKMLGKGYEVRSTYVHGEDPKKFIDLDLISKLKNYAFFSLLIFIQLINCSELDEAMINLKPEYKTKKKAINDYYLYNAQINNKYYNDLKELVGKCDIFYSF